MQINWSEHAIDDLREIVSYVGTSFGRRKAEDVFAEIRHTAELLKDFPMLGRSFVSLRTRNWVLPIGRFHQS